MTPRCTVRGSGWQLGWLPFLWRVVFRLLLDGVVGCQDLCDAVGGRGRCSRDGTAHLDDHGRYDHRYEDDGLVQCYDDDGTGHHHHHGDGGDHGRLHGDDHDGPTRVEDSKWPVK